MHTNLHNLDFFKKPLNSQSPDMKNIELKRRQSKHLTAHIQMFEGLSAEKRQAACCFMTGRLNFVKITKTRNKKIPWFSIQYKEEFSNGSVPTSAFRGESAPSFGVI